MKWSWIKIVTLLSGSLFSITAFSAPESAELLQQMRKATLTLNYEFGYINATRNNIESLRYRHAVVDNKSLAQLLQMDGASREILMRGSEISYFFEQGVEPFSISGDHIIDAMPAIVFADFKRLAKYYDFIPVGQARVANRACQAIRIIAKDGYRYNYMVWIDNESKLPLQIELLDKNNDALEQFRVISFVVDNKVKSLMAGLMTLQLPPLLSQAPNETLDFSWSTGWLPEGFSDISSSRRNLVNVAVPVESRLFSDGLFSFSVNVMPTQSDNANQYLHDGRKIIYAEIRQGYEILVVGEIPQNTAKRIASAVTFTG